MTEAVTLNVKEESGDKELEDKGREKFSTIIGFSMDRLRTMEGS